MSNDETSGQESSGTERRPAHRNELAAAATEKTLKRARWEHLRLAACPGAGRVNVTNYSYGVAAARSGEHTYTVTVDRGEAVGCTCPAAEYQPGPCKHAVKVADAPEVIADAMRGDSDLEPTADGDAARAVADGGQPADAAARLEAAAAKIGDVASYVEYADYAAELTKQQREIEAVATELEGC